MANRLQTTAPYYSEFTDEGEHEYALKKRNGAKAIGIYTGIKKIVGRSPNQHYSIREEISLERLLDSCGSREYPVSKEELFNVLFTLSKTEYVNSELLRKGIIAIPEMMDCLKEMYRRRSTETPTIENTLEKYSDLDVMENNPIDQTNNNMPTTCSQPADNMSDKVKYINNINKQNKIDPEFQPPAVVGEKDIDLSSSLKKQIESIFIAEQLNNRFTNYPKERSAIIDLIKKAESMNPEDPEIFIMGMIQTFQSLRDSDKFFKSQPFLPSSLNSSGIFDRVLNNAQEKFKRNQRMNDMNIPDIPF